MQHTEAPYPGPPMLFYLPCSSPGHLWGLRTQALTTEKGNNRGKHTSSLQLPQASGDRHKTAVGGIALSGRETVEARPHSHWPWGTRRLEGGKGLVARLHHSWQLCQ